MMRHNFEHQRKRISAKLKNSRINQITFHTFRHWKATMEYRKTRDILHVKEILGHKSLNSTMLYTQLISFKDDDFTATVAHSEEEACKLIEAGFEYVCDFAQNKIFRKRKWWILTKIFVIVWGLLLAMLKWTGGDLNPRPLECKSSVHASWTTSP